jgi:hypothetical protein
MLIRQVDARPELQAAAELLVVRPALVLILALAVFPMFALPATIVGDGSASSATAASSRLTHAHLMPALAAFVAILVAMALGRAAPVHRKGS